METATDQDGRGTHTHTHTHIKSKEIQNRREGTCAKWRETSRNKKDSNKINKKDYEKKKMKVGRGTGTFRASHKDTQTHTERKTTH